jgi:hypothetical protein
LALFALEPVPAHAGLLSQVRLQMHEQDVLAVRRVAAFIAFQWRSSAVLVPPVIDQRGTALEGLIARIARERFRILVPLPVLDQHELLWIFFIANFTPKPLDVRGYVLAEFVSVGERLVALMARQVAGGHVAVEGPFCQIYFVAFLARRVHFEVVDFV